MGAPERAADERAVPDVIVITGMSGAGRTEAMHTLEDLGYYVIDNLPPTLIMSLVDLVGINSGVGRHIAIVCDLRGGEFFAELSSALDELASHEVSYKLLFLDASDEVLRRRFSERRRPHPLAESGESMLDSIARERAALEQMRSRADLVLDSSTLSTAELRKRVQQAFSELSDQQLLEVNVFSFGFKYGMPAEADLLVDVRFLPNPFYDPEMRHLTGLDEKVSEFVLDHEQTKLFLNAWKRLLDAIMPGYVAEGKSQLSIAVGCTGGQHRSVTLACATAEHLEALGYHVALTHRDLFRAER